MGSYANWFANYGVFGLGFEDILQTGSFHFFDCRKYSLSNGSEVTGSCSNATHLTSFRWERHVSSGIASLEFFRNFLIPKVLLFRTLQQLKKPAKRRLFC